MEEGRDADVGLGVVPTADRHFVAVCRRQSAVGFNQWLILKGKSLAYKFEKLEVWQLAVEYIDVIYNIAEKLPGSEKYNLASQITRAATSIAFNVAEGSTSQSDTEQSRFLGYAIRSLVETVACQHLIHRRGYLKDPELLRVAYRFSEKLFAKLQAFRSSLRGTSVREELEPYMTEDEIPF